MGKGFDHQLSKIGFGGSGCAEAGAIHCGGQDCLDHIGFGMSQNQRAPGADVVYAFVPVGVPDV